MVSLDPFTWNDDQLKIYTWLERQDDFWKIHEWPDWARKLAITLHKSDSQMYNFMVFLIANGLDPAKSMIWTLANTVHYDIIVMNPPVGRARYTMKEFEDCRRVVEKAKKGTLLLGKKRVYDMNLGRPVQT